MRVDSHLIDQRRAPFFCEYIRLLAISQHPIALNPVSLADLSEFKIDLALEDGLWFGSLMVL